MIPIEFETGDYRTNGLHIMPHHIVDYHMFSPLGKHGTLINTDDGREHFVKHSPAEVTDKICAANKELGGLKLWKIKL